MLLTRKELSYDFKGAQFDIANSAEDRKFLAWAFNQFLYGEVTGIQCGHWLYHAPDLNAATFIAKQASEELSHVRKILRIFSILGESPSPAHWAVRFLSTGMMGGSWGEHVTLEMALGEGLVLSAFYALADTILEPQIHKILESAVQEEERHVEFGERETLAWLAKYPASRKHLLGLALVQVIALRRLKNFMSRHLAKSFGADHAIFKQFSAFYDQVLDSFEIHIEKLGLSKVPLMQMTGFEKISLIFMIPFRKLAARLKRKQPLLTATYLGDAALRKELTKVEQS